MRLERPGERAADGRRQRLLRREARAGQRIEAAERVIDLPLHIIDAVGIGEDVAGERPNFAGGASPARRLDPGIFRRFVDRQNIGFRALGRRTEFEFRLGEAIPRVEAHVIFAGAIGVPGMGDELLHLLRVARIDRMDLLPIAAEDHPARQRSVDFLPWMAA